MAGKFGIAIALTTLLVLTSLAAAQDVEVSKIYFLGKGFAIDPSNSLNVLELKLAAAEVKILGEAQGIGVLVLEGAKFKLSGVTFSEGTLDAVLSGPAGETGSIKCTRVTKGELDLGICSLNVGGTAYTAYVLEAKRSFKAEEKPADTKDYCSKNADDKRCRDYYKDYCKQNPSASECQSQEWPQECLDCRKACEEKCLQVPTNEKESCYLACSPSCKSCNEKVKAQETKTTTTVSSDALGECSRCKEEVRNTYEEKIRAGKERCNVLTGTEQEACVKEVEATAQEYQTSLEQRCLSVCQSVKSTSTGENGCQNGQVRCKQACIEKYGEPTSTTSGKMETCYTECVNSVSECPRVTTAQSTESDYCNVCSERCRATPKPEETGSCISQYVTKCQAYCNDVKKETDATGSTCNSDCEKRAQEVCQTNTCPEITDELLKEKQLSCEKDNGKFFMDTDERGCRMARCENSQSACGEPYKCFPSSDTSSAQQRGCIAVNFACPQVYSSTSGGGSASTPTTQAITTDYYQCFKCPEVQPATACPLLTSMPKEKVEECQKAGGYIETIYDEKKCPIGYQCVQPTTVVQTPVSVCPAPYKCFSKTESAKQNCNLVSSDVNACPQSTTAEPQYCYKCPESMDSTNNAATGTR